MGQGGGNAGATVLLLVAFFAALQVAMAAEYVVGGTTGWDFVPSPTFYKDWAAGIKFVAGDKLIFKYAPGAHNVQEVSQADYASCSGLNPVNQYETGKDVVTLTKAGTHYYICGFLGHCNGGGMLMKLTVRGAASTPPSLPPTTPPAAALPATPPSGAPAPSPVAGAVAPTPLSSGVGGAGGAGAPASAEGPPSAGDALPLSMSFVAASVAAACTVLFF